MKSYAFWTEQSKRWGSAVDYGSPITAWTDEMLRILDECAGDRSAAAVELGKRKAASVREEGLH